ncbi:tip elongation aberrant protein 1 isoform X2 [Folsomia candida]|uniref:tip elongation aberrant protein 1 isoform X2 n=1 Tax=Folsomia candida TaxID=158441 RepID=UPI00160544BF|nr:tip elongation aberrant protein 1 isoform X2 [Folsomia candida]
MWSNIILTKGGVGEDGEPELGNHPPSRYKHCGVLVPTATVANSNYDLYIFGGRSGTFPLKDFWKLDLKLGKWEEIRPLDKNGGEWPPHLQEHSMVYYSSKIYIFGGEISLSYGEDLSPLWIYGVESGSWRRWGCTPNNSGEAENRLKKKQMMLKSPEVSRQALTKTPVGRRGHTATVWNNYMLVYGGYRDLKGSLGDLWAFHFETESWHLFSSHDLHKKNAKPWYFSFSGGFTSSSSYFPCPRHSHIAALHNSSLYIHGGMQDLLELGDLWRFDLKTRLWTQIKTKYGPGPLHGHVGLVALDSLLILAGERGGKAVDEFWRFDFLAETWERIVLNGCRPCPRVWPWGTILPIVYKRVQGTPNENQANSQTSPGSTENKYWWDYDESMLAHPEDDDEGDDDEEVIHHQQQLKVPSSSSAVPNGSSSSSGDEKKNRSSSLFSDFARFAYNNGDYQALSETNSVCLSEEEASPRPPLSNKSHAQQKLANNQCQNGNDAKLELPGLRKIEEQESSSLPPTTVSLIDLGGDETNFYPVQPSQSSHSPPSSTNSPPTTTGNTPESLPEEEGEALTFDSIVPPDSSFNSYSSASVESRPSTTRRSESATCLQLNLKKNSVKKSASVRFADIVEPPSTSSSSHFILARECTSDYSSMEHGINLQQQQRPGGGGGGAGGHNGYENPNYHGSSNTFHTNPAFQVVEAYELDTISGGGANGEIPVAEKVEQAKVEAPYYYQVSTPNYMLLIGGNESHSSHVVSKRQPLAIWRLRVTRDLFGVNPSSSSQGQELLYSSSGNGSSSGSRPSSGSQQRKVTTTGF